MFFEGHLVRVGPQKKKKKVVSRMLKTGSDERPLSVTKVIGETQTLTAKGSGRRRWEETRLMGLHVKTASRL